MSSKILITGGGGYLGSNLATSLIQAGYSVTVVDLMKYSTTSLAHLFNSKKFNLIKGVGHIPCVEAPEKYAKILSDFMKETGHGT